MFGRATITLGIGPHSSYLLLHPPVEVQSIAMSVSVCQMVESITKFTYLVPTLFLMDGLRQTCISKSDSLAA